MARLKYNPDDFDKALSIRKGECDDELPGYEILTGWIQRVPLTWLPALLRAVVDACARRNAFKSDADLLKFAEYTAERAHDPNSILRDT